MYTRVKSEAEIKAMRESGRMLAVVLDLLVDSVQAGMTTKDLSNIAAAKLKELGGKPAFLGYEGYRDVLCVSVNDEVVHGIPGNKIIEDGDIVSVDFGVNYKGMITDAARSVIVGNTPDPEDVELLQATLRSLDAGIFMAKGGCRVGH